MEKIRIAFISAWQAHLEKFASLANEYPESAVVKIWDEDKNRGSVNAGSIGCEFAESVDEIFDDPGIDAVVILSCPQIHAQHILRAANAGKHVFVEKPLCITDEDAERIRDAVKAAGIKFVMSDPVLKPALRYVKARMDEGLIGRIVSARCRCSFGNYTKETITEAENLDKVKGTGGAIGDSHSGHVLTALLGRPLKATAMMSRDPSNTTDLNSISVYEFDGGVLGVAEACVTGAGCPYALEVYGERGEIYSTREEVYIRIGDGDFEKVPAEDMPIAHDYILHYWIKSIYEDYHTDMYTIDEAVDLVRMHNASREASQISVKV